MTPLGTMTITIPSEVEHVFLVGWTINKVCLECGLDELAAYQAELAVVEAVNNAIEHAYHGEPDHTVEIEILVEAERLVFRVAESGKAFDPGAIAAISATAAAAELEEGGRGIAIMRAVMDELRYQSVGGRNVLTLVRRLARAAS